MRVNRQGYAMQIKKWLKKVLPRPKNVSNDASFHYIRSYLHDRMLWSINRRNVAKGVAIGLFVAFIPLPLQMLLAAILSILLRANLLIAVVCTWITNPITFVPINFTIYKVGQWVSGDKGEMTLASPFDWKTIQNGHVFRALFAWIESFGKPFLIGLPIVAITAAIIGYFVVDLCWRLMVTHSWRRRKNRQA